jgi:hypothetical protein
MKMKHSIPGLLACALLTLCTGCASILCGPKQTFSVETQPPGADVLVYDTAGSVVFQSTSPCVAELNRVPPDKERASYVFLIKKEGFTPVQVPMSGHINSAYWANILFGGVGLLVDPATHSMWTLSPSGIDTRKLDAYKGFEMRSDALTITMEGVKSEPGQTTATTAPTVATQPYPFSK